MLYPHMFRRRCRNNDMFWNDENSFLWVQDANQNNIWRANNMSNVVGQIPLESRDENGEINLDIIIERGTFPFDHHHYHYRACISVLKYLPYLIHIN